MKMTHSKKCSRCEQIKIVTDYYRNKKSRDGLEYICKRCSRRRYYNSKQNKDGLYNNDKKIKEHWQYGKGDCIRNKRYIQDRAELFSRHGNGWWWFQGVEQQARHVKGQTTSLRKRFRGQFTRSIDDTST